MPSVGVTCRMHRRYIIGALLGALLGFFGFCVTDFVTGGLSGHWWDGSIERELAKHLPEHQVQYARNLLYEAMVLGWLKERAELAGRTATIAACIGISYVLSADRLRQIRKARKEVDLL